MLLLSHVRCRISEMSFVIMIFIVYYFCILPIEIMIELYRIWVFIFLGTFAQTYAVEHFLHLNL